MDFKAYDEIYKRWNAYHNHLGEILFPFNRSQPTHLSAGTKEAHFVVSFERPLPQWNLQIHLMRFLEDINLRSDVQFEPAAIDYGNTTGFAQATLLCPIMHDKEGSDLRHVFASRSYQGFFAAYGVKRIEFFNFPEHAPALNKQQKPSP